MQEHRRVPVGSSALLLATTLMLAVAVIWLLPGAISHQNQGTAAAQSKKSPRWIFTNAGTIPTEFGELVQVNGTSGNYTLVFQATDKKIRLVDLRGGKIPPRAIVIDRE